MGLERESTRLAAQRLRMLWFAPLLLLPCSTQARAVIDADVLRWIDVLELSAAPNPKLLWLLANYPEFRTLYYYRLRRASGLSAAAAALAQVMYPGERTLFLMTPDIGPGLFIQHGFATIVFAEKVGANCWINQQVTIGYEKGRPVLGDDVWIHSGAQVLGPVTIGNGARVGANAVVLRDVPAGCTAVGVPARILPVKDAAAEG